MPTPLDRLSAALESRYRIVRELGAGGMATVYLAQDLRHGREVAIKVLREEVAGALGADRFLREIAVTAQLDHPNILPLLDSGDANGLLFYVMPYVRGESLRERLVRERQLPVADALSIARDVGDALAYAHTLGIVHRDIKPDNVMLSGTHARLADFGIARALRDISSATLTGTGIIVGSPAYMSPEQAAGDRDLDGRSDVYAMACVLFEMLAGQPPFSGPTQESLLRQHLITPPPDVTQLRPLVPRHVVSALTRALAKAPADRFQTPTDFVAALQDTPNAHSAGERSAPHPLTRRSPGAILAAAAVVVLGIIGGVYALRGRAAHAPASRPLIAVLPFRNIGAAADEYFADGLTEEITSRLTSIGSIGTISRTTALTYKGTTKSLRDIARELGVTYVLEGTVRTERLANGAGQVRVTPELVRADSDTPLWTDRMTAGLAPGELFAVQAQIAERVAGALNLTLAAGERQAIQRVETSDSAAHIAYLQGRFSLAKSSEIGLAEAIAFFTQAVTRDPRYARAFAGLSHAYATAPYFPQARISDSVAFANAIAAARRAIELDSLSSDAHSALASVLGDANWQWAEAERESAVAVRLDPDDASARVQHSAQLGNLRRFNEAFAEAERAVQLEPASASVRRNYTSALINLKRYDEAIASARATLKQDPSFFFEYLTLGDIAALRGDYATAGRELQHIPPLAEFGRALVNMTAAPATRGPVIRAINAIASPNIGLDDARKGWLFAMINERDSSLAAFERSIASHSPGGVSALQFSTVQRALGGNARYTALLKRVNIVVGN